MFLDLRMLESSTIVSAFLNVDPKEFFSNVALDKRKTFRSAEHCVHSEFWLLFNL